MDADAQLKQAVDARLAAAWTTGIVMVAGALFGTVTGNDNMAFVIFFGVGGLGIAWWMWLNDRVDRLGLIVRATRGSPAPGALGMPRSPLPGPPAPTPPVLPPASSATDPSVVVAVIGLVGIALGGLLKLAGS